ncbi:uncharacterized protein BP5553_10480 [Venustampulla echinocandica]|uniref:Uncharacterized protein n=1 Tax=Venustampulla echinocandica TaxID=2656787 RepID=A0A370T9G0_9HELO|nr:uncharacterized protein BP5553_10480 [Venustampulla echinocandica]RDL30202.1 hypothetical protein BP5553_10480 [Venustampulla echinocandica]
MDRATRSLRGKKADKPIAPTAIDIEIGRHCGKTVALEATTEYLQASKRAPTPELSERIHELTKENGQLRLEIKYQQEREEVLKDLPDDAKFMVETMWNALMHCKQVLQEVEDDRAQAMSGVERV